MRNYIKEKGNLFLCARHDVPELLRNAEIEKEKMLRELSMFFTGDIGIRLHENRHLMGYSIAATLTVNGETVREYDPADLCFLELNELMLKRMTESRCFESDV